MPGLNRKAPSRRPSRTKPVIPGLTLVVLVAMFSLGTESQAAPLADGPEAALPATTSNSMRVGTVPDTTESPEISFWDRFGLGFRLGSSALPPRQAVAAGDLWVFLTPNVAVRPGAAYGQGEDYASVEYSARASVLLPLFGPLTLVGSGGVSHYREYSSETGISLDRRTLSPLVGGGIQIRLQPNVRVFGTGSYVFGTYSGDPRIDSFDFDLGRVYLGIRYGGL